jgi:hypothetical protein
VIREVAVRTEPRSAPAIRPLQSRRVASESAGTPPVFGRGHDFGAVRVLDQSGVEPTPGGGPSAPAPAPTPTPEPVPVRGPTGAPAVTIPRIRGTNSPKGTPDRIPPRVDTPVAIKISGAGASTSVTLSIEGGGGGNGSATINRKATVDLTASETVNLRGDIPQTERGKAGKLRFVADQGTTRLASSEPFSVAAYPTAMGFKFYSLMTPVQIDGIPHWGARYEMTDPKFEHPPDSDSGVHGDLDETKIAENVIVASKTGIYKDAVNRHSGFQRTTRPQRDHHGTGLEDAASLIAKIEKVGVKKSKQVSRQLHRFSCARSGLAEDVDAGPKVPTSGFEITHGTSKSDSTFFIDVAKTGSAHNGVAAGTVDDSEQKHATIRD